MSHREETKKIRYKIDKIESVYVICLAYTIIAKYDCQFRYSGLYAYTSTSSLESGFVLCLPSPAC